MQLQPHEPSVPLGAGNTRGAGEVTRAGPPGTSRLARFVWSGVGALASVVLVMLTASAVAGQVAAVDTAPLTLSGDTDGLDSVSVHTNTDMRLNAQPGTGYSLRTTTVGLAPDLQRAVTRSGTSLHVDLGCSWWLILCEQDSVLFVPQGFSVRLDSKAQYTLTGRFRNVTCGPDAGDTIRTSEFFAVSEFRCEGTRLTEYDLTFHQIPDLVEINHGRVVNITVPDDSTIYQVITDGPYTGDVAHEPHAQRRIIVRDKNATVTVRRQS